MTCWSSTTRAWSPRACSGTSPPAAGSRSCSSARSPARRHWCRSRASKPIRAGLEIATAGGTVRVLEREADLWRLALPGAALEFFERWGTCRCRPTYAREADACDRERYQSIFARARRRGRGPDREPAFRCSRCVERARRARRAARLRDAARRGGHLSAAARRRSRRACHARRARLGGRGGLRGDCARARIRRARDGSWHHGGARTGVGRACRAGSARGAWSRRDAPVHHAGFQLPGRAMRCSPTSICPSRRC